MYYLNFCEICIKNIDIYSVFLYIFIKNTRDLNVRVLKIFDFL